MDGRSLTRAAPDAHASTRPVILRPTTYVGFFRVQCPDIIAASQREIGGFPPAFAAKINAFPASFPATSKLIGTWGISGGEAPGVTIVEAESWADLQRINAYYAGWLAFDWHPTATGGVPRNN